MSEFNLNDVNVIECDEEASDDNYVISIQRAINSGMWSLQGSYGRAMMQAIEDGQAMLGPNSARDYWGNFIPSRSQVQAGTKGSREFVVEAMGEDWALMLEAA